MADSPPPATPTVADTPPGVPRWVKVSGAVMLLIVVVLVVSKLAGVEHGPGRHSGSSDPPAQTTPAGTGGGHTGPPPGVTHGSEE